MFILSTPAPIVKPVSADSYPAFPTLAPAVEPTPANRQWWASQNDDDTADDGSSDSFGPPDDSEEWDLLAGESLALTAYESGVKLF